MRPDELTFTKHYELSPVDPQAGDGYTPRLAPTPDDVIRSHLAEVREMAELRDVPFAEIDNLQRYQLPVVALDTSPYISYFLDATFRQGAYETGPVNRIVNVGEYAADMDSYLAMRRGELEEQQTELRSGPIANFRELGSAVHKDWPMQFFARAALCMSSMGIPRNETLSPIDLSATVPATESTVRSVSARDGDITPPQGDYVKSRSPFIDDGVEHLFTAMATLHREAMREAWACKWRDMVARPEKLAAVGYEDPIPMMYAEGAPVHPSDPAGHSFCAGAMVTFLKLWFADAHMCDFGAGEEYGTVHQQLNILGANVAHGRTAGAVHYRSDNIRGLRGGEWTALDWVRKVSPQRGCTGQLYTPMFTTVSP